VHRRAGPGTEIALGWFVDDGTGIVQHNGQTNGYHSFVGYDPRQKVGVVVLSNSAESIDDIAWKIFNYTMTGPREQQLGPGGLLQ
jgi:CubicO group peptidase (beta-lactamase class C family)